MSFVADLLGCGQAEAEDVLEELVDASLLDSPAPGRYRCHVPVRAFAHGLNLAAAPGAGFFDAYPEGRCELPVAASRATLR